MLLLLCLKVEASFRPCFKLFWVFWEKGVAFTVLSLVLLQMDHCCARYCFDADFILFLRRMLFLAWYFPAIGLLTLIKVGSSPFAVFRSRKLSPWSDFLFGSIGATIVEQVWTLEVAGNGGFSRCNVAWYDWSTDLELIGSYRSRKYVEAHKGSTRKKPHKVSRDKEFIVWLKHEAKLKALMRSELKTRLAGPNNAVIQVFGKETRGYKCVIDDQRVCEYVDSRFFGSLGWPPPVLVVRYSGACYVSVDGLPETLIISVRCITCFDPRIIYTTVGISVAYLYFN